MTRTLVLRSSLVAALAMLVSAPPARAQSPPPANAQSTAVSAFEDPRPATPTFLGDTGIWYVPTGEILRSGTWSAAGDRRGTNYVQGSSNVADFAGTGAIGIGNRVELFGAFLFDTRVNRDDRPVFADDAREGGIAARYPRVNSSWTGNNVGDLYIGTKVNLLSQQRRAPLALAIRGIVKLPTGDEHAGVSTGRSDVMADLIVSREFARFFEAATYVGYEVRGQPSGVVAPNGSYRWGTGVTFPSRSALRLSAEANGDLPTNYRATLTDNSVVGDDGSLRPFASDIRNRTRATGGVTYQTSHGVFVGTGLSWNAPRFWDWQVRVGYHGRSRTRSRSVATATVPAAATTIAASQVPEATRAAVVPAPSAQVLAPSPPQAQAFVPPASPAQALVPPAPSAPVFAPPAPSAPAFVPPPPFAPPPLLANRSAPVAVVQGTYTFEDVYFDLDGFSLRAETISVLDVAARAMLADAMLNIDIEGHTCNIASGEYNLALATRRANAVRDYFVSRGVTVSRLRTATFGEDDPEHSNAHEQTRQLNRRVALVVRLRP